MIAYSVPSFTSDKRYTVTSEGETYRCSCPDFYARKRECKHIRAVHVLLEPESLAAYVDYAIQRHEVQR